MRSAQGCVESTGAAPRCSQLRMGRRGAARARRSGEAIQLPLGLRRSAYLLTRPEHAEHVLTANQDNYVKAFTYRPLRALIGTG
jgi:hypothetical protein